MDITELYMNEKFNNLLVVIANKEKISSFDDYKQDVFLDIINSGVIKYSQFEKSAWKIGLRYYREIIDQDIINEFETEDETMSRLIYNGKAWQVG